MDVIGHPRAAVAERAVRCGSAPSRPGCRAELLLKAAAGRTFVAAAVHALGRSLQPSLPACRDEASGDGCRASSTRSVRPGRTEGRGGCPRSGISAGAGCAARAALNQARCQSFGRLASGLVAVAVQRKAVEPYVVRPQPRPLLIGHPAVPARSTVGVSAPPAVAEGGRTAPAGIDPNTACPAACAQTACLAGKAADRLIRRRIHTLQIVFIGPAGPSPR